jgi:hypothetical protein
MGLKNKTTKTTVPSTKEPSASEDGGFVLVKLTDGLVKMTLKKKKNHITLNSPIVHHSYIISGTQRTLSTTLKLNSSTKVSMIPRTPNTKSP